MTKYEELKEIISTRLGLDADTIESVEFMMVMMAIQANQPLKIFDVRVEHNLINMSSYGLNFIWAMSGGLADQSDETIIELLDYFDDSDMSYGNQLFQD